MVAPGGGSAARYESPQGRALSTITFESYEKVYDDQAKFMSKLAGDVSYMAGSMRKMQRGIDTANENFMQQIQDLVNNVVVIMGGGSFGDSGIDLGDLKYVLQAVGALLGFQSVDGIPLPINVVNAAWHFFSAYIFPADNFQTVIDTIVDGIIAAMLGPLGTIPIAGQAAQQLAVIISDIRDLLDPIAAAVDSFFSVFSINLNDTGQVIDYFGPLQPIFDAFTTALNGVNLPDFSSTFHEIALWTLPFVNLLADVITAFGPMLTDTVNMGAGVITPIVNQITPLIVALAPILTGITSVVNGLNPILDGVKGVLSLFGFGSAPSGFVAATVAGNFFTNWLTSGGLPNFDASKITTGVLSLLRIPGLPTSQITSGTFLSSFFPQFGMSQSAGSNLVLDPGFENPAQWAYTLNAANSISSTRAHGGTYSARIVGPTVFYCAGNDSGVTLIKTRPGEKFRVGAWIWPEAANAGTGQVYFILNSVAADGTFVVNTLSPNYATLTKGQWNYVETILTADAGVYGFYPMIWTPGIPNTDVYYFDDMLWREETTTQNVIQQLFGGTSVLTSVLSAVIPNLDASKLTTGTLLASLIPALAASWGKTIDSSLLINLIASAILPNFDASKITTGVLNLLRLPNFPISQVTTLPGLLSTMFSPFNPPQVVGPGQIAVTPQNLLKNWNFPDANSMAGETVWAWDAATQAGTGGSAKVNAAINTNTKALQSDPIQVVPKDVINTSVWTQWNSLTYTGTPISLMLNLYDVNNTFLTQITLATATMTGATSGWVQLTGVYTIPDASTAVWARLVYNVSTTATAGSVWFTNGSFTKPNPIPQAAVQDLTGILGAANVGTTIQNFLDKGVQGIVNDMSLVGQSLAAYNAQINNLARFVGYVISGAAPVNSVAQIASNVDNTVKARAVQKAFNDNIDPTTDAVFKLKDVWQNATLPTVPCTSGATVMGDITIRDGGDKNAVTWYGYPTSGAYTNITDFRVNIYSVNKTNNVRTKVHGSINLIGSATPPGTGSAPVFNSYNLPSSIANAPGDRLTAEIAILGTGTYNIVGQTISPQIPFHASYGLHGLTRASAAAPTTVNPPGIGGSPLSYSRSIPWIGMSGTQSATQYTPVIVPFYSSGGFNPALYNWANYIDIIVCGPGGNGMNGSGYWGGYAGTQGGWNAATLTKAQWSAATINANITGGGSQAASSVTVSGWGTLSGGAGTNGTQVSGTSNLGAPGPGPGDYFVNGTNYPGGNGGATAQAAGGQPGGAGAGGNAPFTVGTNIYGGPGGAGIAYIKAYQ